MRNLKALGLALMVVFAIGSAAAPTAPAQQGKLTADGPVTLDMTEAGAWNAFTVLFESVECPFSSYTGHAVGGSQPLSNGSTTVTVTPNYKNCRTWIGGSGFYSTTIDMNGCDYVMHFSFTFGIESYSVTTDIVCPEGKDIQVTVFSSSSHALKLCTLTLKSQSGLTGANTTNTSGFTNDVDVAGTFRFVKAEKSGLCGAGSSEMGEIDVNLTLQGTGSEGGATNISITD
ncbi:MAG TPA: hypothetical protein VFM94_05295 [Solirubrobacterales bacterium]|nr:hypothetical protein [Solirubrobacterales bacterium]